MYTSLIFQAAPKALDEDVVRNRPLPSMLIRTPRAARSSMEIAAGELGGFKRSSQHDPLLVDRSTPVNWPHRIAAFGDALVWWAQPGKGSAVLGLVQDEPALRAGAASGILRQDLCAALSRRQVGSKEWVLLISPRNAIWVLRPDRRRPKAAISPCPEAYGFVPEVT